MAEDRGKELLFIDPEGTFEFVVELLEVGSVVGAFCVVESISGSVAYAIGTPDSEIATQSTTHIAFFAAEDNSARFIVVSPGMKF